MISFEEFKKILGSYADGKSDEEINNLRILLDKMADIIFDRWLRKLNANKINLPEQDHPV